MRLQHLPPMREASINVTPLIDIVMCLIIFFMLVARVGIDSGADKHLEIPTSFIGTDIRDMGNTLTLNVINGSPEEGGALPIVTALVKGQMIDLKLQQIVDGQPKSPLRETLEYIRNGDPGFGIPPNPDFKVIIRGDKSLTYRFLAPVLVQCNLAKVSSFAINTKKP